MTDLTKLLDAIDKKVASDVRVVKTATVKVEIRPITMKELQEFSATQTTDVEKTELENQDTMMELFAGQLHSISVGNTKISIDSETDAKDVLLQVSERLNGDEVGELFEKMSAVVGISKMIQKEGS